MSDGREVAVIGGGIAGLTVAHELVSRGFTVKVIEVRGAGPGHVGGKAASQYPPYGNGQLLGEHGFRFFPAFYETIFETMERIPVVPDAGDPSQPLAPVSESVRSVLRPVEQFSVARANTRLARVPRDVPRIDDLADLARALAVVLRDVPPADLLPLGAALVHYYTRGRSERLRVYEKQSFWDFVDGDTLDPVTQRVLRYLPKSLVAMNPRRGNTRTLLDLFWLMLVDFGRDRPSDFVLPGPTTDTFIAPWHRWLRRLGVRFEEAEVGSFSLAAGRVVAQSADGSPIEADTYFLATPLEVTRAIVGRSEEVADASRVLARVGEIGDDGLGWMVGAQLFLRREPAALGHLSFPDAPWALTGIVQSRHWDETYRARLRSLGIGAVLSVIATEWDAPLFGDGPSARECTRAEIREELQRQIGACLDDAGHPLSRDADVVTWHLDESLELDDEGRPAANHAPLLVHPPDLWSRRPTPWTELPNLYLCGDYVRSPIDLATMEGANATARWAVNAFLDATQHPPWDRCFVQPDYLAANTPAWLRAIQDMNDTLFHEVAAPKALHREELTSLLGLTEAAGQSHEQAAAELSRLAPIIALRH
jgi:uncharacterized protein with NAD-binding domain and iron-sulfur cluster